MLWRRGGERAQKGDPDQVELTSRSAVTLQLQLLKMGKACDFYSPNTYALKKETVETIK